MTTKIGSFHNEIKVYDSLYKTIDQDTKTAIMNMFKKMGQVKIDSVDMQIQRGDVDCGVFAVAVATALANGDDPTALVFNLRHHLLQCLESGILTTFPTQL